MFLIQNDPWFSLDDSFKIFNNIYGQHNRIGIIYIIILILVKNQITENFLKSLVII